MAYRRWLGVVNSRMSLHVIENSWVVATTVSNREESRIGFYIHYKSDGIDLVLLGFCRLRVLGSGCPSQTMCGDTYGSLQNASLMPLFRIAPRRLRLSPWRARPRT